MTSKTIEVPREPTDEMFRAFERAYAKDHSFHAAWIAACTAAPEAPRLDEPMTMAFLHCADGCEPWVNLRRDNSCNPRALILQDHHRAHVENLKRSMAAPLSPDHSGGGAGMVIDERAEFENYYRDRIMGNRTGVRFLRSSNGAYLDREVVEMWSGWQARACLDKVKELNQ